MKYWRREISLSQSDRFMFYLGTPTRYLRTNLKKHDGNR